MAVSGITERVGSRAAHSQLMGVQTVSSAIHGTMADGKAELPPLTVEPAGWIVLRGLNRSRHLRFQAMAA